MANAGITGMMVALMGLEGVGSYGTGDPTTLLAGNAFRCQSFTFTDTPNFIPRGDKSPQRPGFGSILAGRTTDWTAEVFFQEFIVPTTDEASRPPQNRLLLAACYIASWLDVGGGGAGPFQRIYTLQSHFGLMDSVYCAFHTVMNDGATMVRESANGMRANHTRTYTPGQPISMTLEGKGINYVGPADVAVIVPSNNFNTEIIYEATSVTISDADGAPVYAGPLMEEELTADMNMGETPGGGAGGVAEVTLVPVEAFKFRFRIDFQEFADWNARTKMNVGQLIQRSMVLSTATSGSRVRELWQGQIVSIEDVDVNGRKAYDVNCDGVYIDTAGPVVPAEVPVLPFTFIWETDL